MSIAPTTDDVWFWAMALLKGTRVHWISDGMIKLYNIETSQETTACLTDINDQGEKLFITQLNNVVNKYDLRMILEDALNDLK